MRWEWNTWKSMSSENDLYVFGNPQHNNYIRKLGRDNWEAIFCGRSEGVYRTKNEAKIQLEDILATCLKLGFAKYQETIQAMEDE